MKRREFYDGTSVLVTGGAGFIGSHLVEKLVQKAAHVTILDDLSSGSLKNIDKFKQHISFLAGDITNFDTCYKATKNKKVIFHLAAMASVPESIKFPAACKKINVTGTQNLLECAKEHAVQSFIFSSSSAVYGQRTDICAETDTPNPETPYAISKLEGEKLCSEYAHDTNMNIACLRYFNVYGERQNPNGSYAAVVAKFTHNLQSNQPIIIYGNGKQKRDFIPVSQVVSTNLMMAHHKHLRGDVFNVATGKSITLLQLLKQLEAETQTKRVGLIFKPARAGDIFCSKATCKKLQAFQKQ